MVKGDLLGESAEPSEQIRAGLGTTVEYAKRTRSVTTLGATVRWYDAAHITQAPQRSKKASSSKHAVRLIRGVRGSYSQGSLVLEKEGRSFTTSSVGPRSLATHGAANDWKIISTAPEL